LLYYCQSFGYIKGIVAIIVAIHIFTISLTTIDECYNDVATVIIKVVNLIYAIINHLINCYDYTEVNHYVNTFTNYTNVVK